MAKKTKAGFMFGVVIGPICGFSDEEEKKNQLREMFRHNYFPLGVVTKGELFDNLYNTLPPEEAAQLKGVILCAGYDIVYVE